MKKVLAIILIFFVIGCAKKYAKMPEELTRMEKDVKAEEVQKEKTKETEIVKEKILTSEKPKEVVLTEVKESIFEFKDALFDYDKYDIRPDARGALDSIAEWLNKNKNVNVFIEGHCDERGTNEYNLALGEKRANAAKEYLLARGIAAKKINTISYGEEKPLCTKQNEDCYQKNRRAHFIAER